MLCISLLLEIGIFAIHLVWHIRTRSLHRRAKADGVEFDDLPEAKNYEVPSDRKSATLASSSLDVELDTGGQGEWNIHTIDYSPLKLYFLQLDIWPWDRPLGVARIPQDLEDPQSIVWEACDFFGLPDGPTDRRSQG